MSGTIVYEPKRDHRCSPGWRWETSTGGPHVPGAPPPLPKGARYGVPPSPSKYPKGTVWQCACGQTWVSQGSPAEHMPGVCTWRREGRWERRRRERRSQP